MTPAEQLHKEFYKQEFSARRAVRYYTARATFWMGLLRTSEVLGFLLNATAFAFLFTNDLIVGRIVVAFSSLLSILVLCFQATNRWDFNISQKRRFNDLLSLFPADESSESPDLLKKIKDERSCIERNDDTLFQCLSVRCHNEECAARGLHREEKPLTWVQLHIGAIIPLRYCAKA